MHNPPNSKIQATNLGSFTADKENNASSDAGIMKWKDGKKAVFLLSFDDSCESHLKNVIPELVKRDMVGTFYINPGCSPFQSQKKAWENEIPKTNMEYGNHTFMHKGAPSVEVLDEELAACQDVINKCFPKRKQPRLISFGQPGGNPWTISEDEKNQLLKKYNLVQRPTFSNGSVHEETLENVLKPVDNAIATGEMGHHVFHGVGGDWHVTSMEIFLALLDKLEANKSNVWITDPVSYHKYLTERNAAELKRISATNDTIKLQLTCGTDISLYDLPLTLYVRVPDSWKTCVISQNQNEQKTQPANGILTFAAQPISGQLTVQCTA